MNNFPKRVAEVLDYGLDLRSWLEETCDGDGVASSSSAVTPAGLTIQGTRNATSEPRTWCTGGNPGTVYTITVTVVTDGEISRIKEFDFEVTVTE